MADKNLHDIKIDDLDNQKKTPLKNILTLLALLFIILVISVVITKLILNTDEGQELDTNLTTSQISTDAENNSDANNNSALTATGVAITGAAGAVASTAATNVKDTLSNTTNSVSTPKIKERNVTNSSKTRVTLRDHQPKKTVKEVASTHKKTTHKKSYIEKKKVVKKTQAKKSIASYNLTNGYYIKVGTFRDISTAVAKVKKTGLNYKLIKTKNDKTMTRVLIGPFSEEEAAKSHLKEVQTNITSGAYITRIK